MSPFKVRSNFDPRAFLNEKWQQKPTLLDGFFEKFDDPLSADELAGLACEAEVESRLVSHESGEQWQQLHGPFAADELRALPQDDWTLLVQAVDQWEPGVEALKSAFSFLPTWRIDDIMVSYAVTGGSVGPHFDHYDVFLVQGAGQRRWLLGPRCGAGSKVSDRSGLSLLDEFDAEREVVLNQGDVLYIPPGFSHYGTALTDSLCYSVGFRAPSRGEMLEGFSDRLIAASDPSQRYTDTNATPPARPGEIDTVSLRHAYQDLLTSLDSSGEFQRWFGCFVTEPRYPDLILGLNRALSVTAVAAAIARGSQLRRNPASRFAYLPPQSTNGGLLLFFADGEDFELPGVCLDTVRELCSLSAINYSRFDSELLDQRCLPLLTSLINRGSLLLREDDAAMP